MPQPISCVAPNVSIMISNAGDRVLARHPDLAILAIEAIASWSNVESFMLNLYVQLMGGPDEIAATAYLALETQSAKTRVIRAVAEKVLSGDNLALLVAILAVAKTRQKSRNKLAHHVWGDSPQVPDAVFLTDPKSLLQQPLPLDQVYVYRRADFNEIIQGNVRLCGYGRTFRQIIVDRPGLNKDSRLYDLLCEEPEIRERLNSQS